MSNQELIISLIQQDLKHSQLILGLDDLGLSASDKHSLEMFDIVADLMQVPEGHLESKWASVYLTYMSECREVEIQHMTLPMQPYAISCYNDLCEILNSENASWGNDWMWGKASVLQTDHREFANTVAWAEKEQGNYPTKD